ncbi:MAG: response regulator [Anaerolineae bacterium]|nr:response regulator [Anaerolineae bacterium]
MHILYLEDSDTDIDLMRRYANTLKGVQITIAKTEDDALHQLNAQHPDIFLADVMINGKAVYDLIKRSAHEGLAGHVILLTAKALPAEIQYYQSLGCDHVIAKPYTVDELDRVLLQFA